MKKISRIIALTTLALYIGFNVVEAFHASCAGHTEANCAICQVVHQTPFISQAKPVIQHHEAFQRIVFAATAIVLFEREISYHGLSPPIL